MSRFQAEAYQNEYLPIGGTEVNAVVTVTALDGAPAQAPAGMAAEIVIVDTSGSMAMPPTKLRAAKEATAVAIDCLRDGVAFGMIAGTRHGANGLPDHRDARAGVSRHARGGQGRGRTAGGRRRHGDRLVADGWPTVCSGLALMEFTTRFSSPTGRTSTRRRRTLDAALARCQGRFQCDCRGVGTEWEVSELRRVASMLLGTVDIIAEPSEMAARLPLDHRAGHGRGASKVSLRLWTPQGAEVAFVKQVSPSIEDHTAGAIRVDAQTTDYPTGAWGDGVA